MELVQVDSFHSEPPKRVFAAGLETVRAPVPLEMTWPGGLDARLGGNHESVRIRMERLRYEFLDDMGSVRVGRIDEVDARVDNMSEQCSAEGRIGWRPPYVGTGEAHGAETQAPNRQISSKVDRFGSDHRLTVPPRKHGER